MNFVGHVAVALDVEAGTGDRDRDQEAYLVGVALPDLAAMGRFRLLDRPDPRDEDAAALSRGIDLHHRTDDVFHRHPWFRTHSSAVAAELERSGLARGAARACGHVGVEMLLDGHLLANRPGLRASATSAIAGTGRRIDRLAPLVAEGQRPSWRNHVRRLTGWAIPDDYQQPEAVATRLQRILVDRRRLAFPAQQIPLVAATLAEHHDELTAGAITLLGDLTDQLTEPG